jgi:hypothetical protein
MDRIFLNLKTGQTLISYKNGIMYETDTWKKIGTINTREFVKTLSASQREAFRGAVKIS